MPWPWKLLNIEVPERAQYIRVIMAELTRVINHIGPSALSSTTWARCGNAGLYAIEGGDDPRPL